MKQAAIILISICVMATTLFFCSTTVVAQSGITNSNNTLPNECWTFTDCTPHHRCLYTKYYLYKDGSFKVVYDIATQKGSRPVETGTYYYQPETDELFLSITKGNYSNGQKVKTKKYFPPKKLCIAGTKDVTVSQNGEKNKIPYILFYDDWEIIENGKYNSVEEGKKLYLDFTKFFREKIEEDFNEKKKN
jgi:hypothetical protein